MAKHTNKVEEPEVLGTEKEVVRITFRLHGPELAQMREVQEMLSLNSELDAARYIMQRGLEAMTPILTSRRSQTQMAQGVSPENIVAAMKSVGFDKLMAGEAK